MENLAPFADRARVERADATALPFEDGRFDAVLAFTMLHHVLKWEDALREAVRVLGRGGRLIGNDLLDSPAFRLMHHRERSQVRMMRGGELEQLLAELPLEDVHVKKTGLGLLVRFGATRR
jgi:ubiquinone/menaquinone biosynthesis C-methylase UbiE